MADVSLDDLIRKDKQKTKPNKIHKNKAPFNKPKPFVHKNNERNNNRQERQNNNAPKGNHQAFKNKPIRKQFQGKFKGRPEIKDREDKVVPQRPKQQNHDQQQKRQKELRTLKVLGISPQFTNEDLYKLFAAEGSLEKCLIEVDNFGRSQTTAVVQYHQTQAVQNAIRNLNGHKIKNGVLTVQPYKNIKK